MAKDRTLRHAVEADTRDSDEFYLESDCDEELVRGNAFSMLSPLHFYQSPLLLLRMAAAASFFQACH